MGKKRARFADLDHTLDVADLPSVKQTNTPLCLHMGSASSSQICLRVHDNRISLLEECHPLEALVLSSPSLSLSGALQIGHLSNKMKVILAYIVARSVWEFYDSDWMSRPWTAEDIHFLRERPDDGAEEPVVSINRPYLAVRWEELPNPETDISNVIGKIHRYPRILSLGLMLIEIGTGQPAMDLFQGQPENINSDWLSAKAFLSKSTPWDDFDYRCYWDAARSCINNHFYLTAAPVVSEAESRRRMILEEVISPLEDLLAGTGWIHDISTVGPMKPLVLSSMGNTLASLTRSREFPENPPSLDHTGGASLTRSQTSEPSFRTASRFDQSFDALSLSGSVSQTSRRHRLNFEIAIICALPARLMP